MEGNFFAFNSLKEFDELKNDTNKEKWEYVEGPGKPGTLISPRLREHWYKDFSKCWEKKFVICFNRFNGDGSFSHAQNLVTSFGGEKLIIYDTTDKIFCYPAYMNWILETGKGLYIKKNLGRTNDYYDIWKKKKNRQDWPQGLEHHEVFHELRKRDLLVPGPESPPAGNVRAWLDYGPKFKDLAYRKYDIFFAGQTRSGYKVGNKIDQIESLKDAAKSLNLKSMIIDKSQNLGRIGYMSTLNNSKFCYNFSIGPLRNRREWEILLAGGLLVQDWRTADMEKDIMIPDRHYVYFEQDMVKQLENMLEDWQISERIAYEGWELAQECWCKIPNLEFRLFKHYFSGKKRPKNLEELGG